MSVTFVVAAYFVPRYYVCNRRKQYVWCPRNRRSSYPFPQSAVYNFQIQSLTPEMEENHPALSEWAVQLPPGVNADEFAAQHGFKNKGQIGILDGFYLLEMHEEHRQTRDVAEGKLRGMVESPRRSVV